MATCSNLRMTKQRRVILDELRKVRTHPTADEIYELVRKREPRISLGTVYRNLEFLSTCRVIRKIEVAGSQKRFDGDASEHYHVRCTKCGRVDDIEMKPLSDVEKIAGKVSEYEVVGHRLEILGICPSCKGLE